jgi:hypothetical protein
VPFLKFGRAIGCGHAIEVRSTRSWREMDSNLRFLSQEKPVYVAEGELRGDRTGHQRNLRGTDSSNPSPSSGESATNRFRGSNDYDVTVLSGTMYLGMGDKFDPARGEGLKRQDEGGRENSNMLSRRTLGRAMAQGAAPG